MIRITSEWAQRTIKPNLLRIGTFFTTPFAAKAKLLSLRWLTSHALTKSTLLFHSLPPVIVPSENTFNPHTYTDGRWLHRDKLQRDARYIQFSFDALRERVIELCPGAISITRYEKKEGGFNRVFIFTCDNGKRIVARLPTSVAGPPRLTTNSEVATIKYLQSKTTVPIPTILDWSDDPSNPIGSEYIIMEHALGVQLHQRWPTMSGVQQIKCILAISKNVEQIVEMEFPAYGSIYLDEAPIDFSSKKRLAQGFCIGPHCGTRYWDCNIGETRYYHSTKPNRGPWTDLAAYCDGLIDTGLSRLPPSDSTLPDSLPFYGTVATHVRLLSFARDVIHKVSEDPQVRKTAVPTLHHADLHKRNIFVSEDDPTIITGLIDWQSSSIEPAFEYADAIPDFAAFTPEVSSEDQVSAPEVSSEDQAPKTRKTNAELCRQCFDACVQFIIPRLSAARSLDDNLIRPFRYCHRTWSDGAVFYRQELIEVSSRWEALGLPNSCPYPLPTSDEMVVYQREFKTFVTAQELRQDMVDILNTDSEGWVSSYRWEATKAAHKEVFVGMCEAVRNAESTDEYDEPTSEEQLKKMWPFDIPE